MGGDEFLLLLPSCKPDEVRHVLGRLSEMKMDLCGQATRLDFSVGWANYIQDEAPDELLKRADEALYANKRSRQDPQKATTSQTV
jgi:GGDEF domain-containing protein